MNLLELIIDRRFKKLLEINYLITIWFDNYAGNAYTFGHSIHDEYYVRYCNMPYSNYYKRFGNLIRSFSKDKEIQKIDVGCSGAGFEATFHMDNDEYSTVDKFFNHMKILNRC